jgi:hypothetical protein
MQTAEMLAACPTHEVVAGYQHVTEASWSCAGAEAGRDSPQPSSISGQEQGVSQDPRSLHCLGCTYLCVLTCQYGTVHSVHLW